MRQSQDAVLVRRNLNTMKRKRTEWQHARNRAVRQERERLAALAARKADEQARNRLHAELIELETKLPAVQTTRDHALEAQRGALDEQVLVLQHRLREVRFELNTRLRARQL